ncbi:hypothetical protein [Vibrio cionasavignyae]|uniref:hypothetical protein n=1 Tax=Vibrio cionasavignyae TaxID=2910252 RepID=UPI003D0D0D1A
MSAKFTHIAWQQTNVEASEKLVLLKLADLAGHDGSVSIALADIANECLLGEFRLADVFTSLVNKGVMTKSHVETRGRKQIHHLKLLAPEGESVSIPVVSMPVEQASAPIKVSAQNESSAPGWSHQQLNLYKVPANRRDEVWQSFMQESNPSPTMNINRLAGQLDNWLEYAKQSGNLRSIIGVPVKPQATNTFPSASTRRKQGQSQGESQQYISTHELNEFVVPEWAQQPLAFSRLEIDPNLFWEKFVVYYKARANEYTSVTQMLNKLRLWIVNEKQAEDRRKQAEERRRQSYQNNKSVDVSPSEEFREFLRGQGKKPDF